jgi:hypothetical protein
MIMSSTEPSSNVKVLRTVRPQHERFPLGIGAGGFPKDKVQSTTGTLTIEALKTTPSFLIQQALKAGLQ